MVEKTEKTEKARDPVRRWRSVWVAKNGGQGRFLPAVEVPLGTGNAKDPNPVWLGDFEGNGLAEVVFRQSLDDPKDGGMRQELAEFREPKSRLTFRRLSQDLVPEKTPYRTLDVTGWGFEAADSDGDPGPGKPTFFPIWTEANVRLDAVSKVRGNEVGDGVHSAIVKATKPA